MAEITNMKKPPKDYRAVTSPSYNVQVYDYWGDCYESVFLMHKPFFRFRSHSKYNIDRINKERSKWHSIIQNECEPIKWQEVKEKGGFAEYWQIDDGLNINPDFIDNKKKLEAITDELELLYPYEDFFSPFQVDTIQNSLKYLGYKELVIGAEHPEIDEEEVYDINTNRSNLWNSSNIYPADKKILFTSPFDMHVSFICSEREVIEKLKEEFQIEGFYCSADTTTWWSRRTEELVKFEV
ncbi:hypothetical protein [Pontibacter sp. H249]|uniref:hypothetical protein n=1 Tax=Pontibacter sp. H249 TaxID=3133420 RepID=UPI0030C1494C